MAPSQLKQLKASLRESGLVGPQKSKKQKKQIAKDGSKRLQRNAALAGIRERFNPFEFKTPARREKFEVVTNKPSKSGPGRPGVTKGLGEERRRETLLKEINTKNKTGGLLDRRFGENDPTMTPEQRAAERFAKQTERKLKKSSMYNLEDNGEEEMVLTHGGMSLDFGNRNDDVVASRDDFSEDDVVDSDGPEADEFEGMDERFHKRPRLSKDEENQDSDGALQLPERKKSKQEVMKEVIAKSKLHRYERQQAKEDDDDLRAELDKGMSEFYEAIRDHKVPKKSLPTPPSTDSEPAMNPDRAAILAGKDRQIAEKEYNERLRQMAMDERAKPSTRTKTEEERAAGEAQRLQEQEKERLRRMQGDPESSEDELSGLRGPDEDFNEDDAEAFGLGQPAPVQVRKDLDVEDEDDFALDDDLIASDSGADLASDASLDDSSDDDEGESEDDGDDDFINGLSLPAEPRSNPSQLADAGTTKPAQSSNLAFAYPCPETHGELLAITGNTKVEDLPVIVQRIRALYHPGLAEGNKDKLRLFASVLTSHLCFLANMQPPVPVVVFESLLRHLHSMAKTQPEDIGSAFRAQLKDMADTRPLHLTTGDLVILTGVSTIFPTSDHFHSVVTPAMLTLARYLGQSRIRSLNDLAIGAFCCTLALTYQKLSKRYVPELMTYVTNALMILSPVSLSSPSTQVAGWSIPVRMPDESLAYQTSKVKKPSRLRFVDLMAPATDSKALSRITLLTFVDILDYAAELWISKSTFNEIFEAPVAILTHITSGDSATRLHPADLAHLKASLTSISQSCAAAVRARKPLALHHHRPLAIKTSIPKFEESYNPDRLYDPDRERADLSKLRAEHQRERKGALRELRKDANFVARESLREKKERDAAYERKFKRLVAEIQGEEGHEANAYGKVKNERVRKRKR